MKYHLNIRQLHKSIYSSFDTPYLLPPLNFLTFSKDLFLYTKSTLRSFHTHNRANRWLYLGDDFHQETKCAVGEVVMVAWLLGKSQCLLQQHVYFKKVTAFLKSLLVDVDGCLSSLTSSNLGYTLVSEYPLFKPRYLQYYTMASFCGPLRSLTNVFLWLSHNSLYL